MKIPSFFSAGWRLSFVFLFLFTQTNDTYSQEWDYVGTPGISEGTAGFPSLVFNGNTPYVAYMDGNISNKATVKQFDGTSWVTVGNAGFSAGSATYTNLVFNGNTPYIAFKDGGNNNRTTVMKFDGANWVTVGNPGFPTRQSWFAPLAFEGSTPYVAYWDGGSINKATVKKFDGINWVTVGTEGFSAGVPVNISIAFVGNTPYVCYRDDALNFIVVKSFDGTNWVTVGPDPGVSATSSDYPSFVVHNGIPYVAYRDAAANNMVTVKKFDGANWVTIGSPGFSRGAASNHSLAFNGNTPYLLFADGMGKATLMKFDGVNWVLEGPQGFSVGSTTDFSVAFNSGIPYAAYRDGGISNKAVVAKFDPTPATGLNFDGVNDYVRVFDNNTLDFGNGNFTVECRTMKLAASSGYANSSVAGKWSTGATRNEWLLQNTLNGNDNLPAFSIESGTTTYTVSGTTSMALNTWYHLAAVRDGATLKLFVNGVLEGTITLPANTTINNAGQHLSMASFRSTGGTVMYSNINLDELRIWNRALCLGELQATMNCDLNAAGQTGLMALYGFNQGFVGDNNNAFPSATDASGNNNHGVLFNFTLSGTTSNWSNGIINSACSVYTPSGIAATAGGSQVCQSALVQTPGTIYQDALCNYIAKVSPSGASPVSGIINTCVTIDATVQSYNNQPYVQRHYDIEPATGAATATGTITLIFTQAEFDAYNATRGIFPALPADAIDSTGMANLVISQYHGTGTTPGNYTGTHEWIKPAPANIVWNAAQSRWEVTFDVTGFSGFFVQAINGALPVKLLSFSATKMTEMNLLKWTTTEEINAGHFEVERSLGNGFEKIGFVKAAGNSGTEKQYAFEDRQPFAGTNHYRLKMVDQDGHAEYSKIVTLKSDGRAGISVYPNPVQSKLFVEGAINGTIYQIKNTSGQVVSTGLLNTEGINLNKLSTGVYILVVNGAPFKFIKQ